MTTDAVLTRLTWEEFLALPADPALRHAELVDGEVVLNPPTGLHQLAVGQLWSAINAWCRSEQGSGEVTMDPPVQITDRRGYLPDIAWYPADRCAAPGESPAFSGPPALAVEVLSPSTRLLDAQRKRSDYARVGVGELWLVDPEVPAALLLRRDEASSEFRIAADLAAGDALTTPLLDGFSVTLRSLVARP